jgi:uncharacterized protein (DUF1697 family)
LIYSVSRSRLAGSTAKRARRALHRVCGLTEPVFICSFQHLVELVAEDPFAAFDDSTAAGRTMSFFEPKIGTTITAPLESERRDCLVFRIGAGEAFSVIREVNGKTGYPTGVLENALNSPVTTRMWTTILRIVKKHG